MSYETKNAIRSIKKCMHGWNILINILVILTTVTYVLNLDYIFLNEENNNERMRPTKN